MQQQHSSQATSTLGNTPNLNIGFLHQKENPTVAIRRVVAPAPQPEPASRLRSSTRDVSFLRSDSRCRRYVSDLPNVTPRYFGSEQKGWVSLLYLTLSSRLASLLLRWKAADTVFVVMNFSFQVWKYLPTVAMSLVSTPSTACQQGASGARRVMAASCEVTQGVGDTWATCPTLLRGISARSRRAWLHCCIWL